ncbi:MAG: site-2 protease family protein [Phycisphaerales bacterium]|nr:site-2 protease family protein [Phycisphaerales bacterium]
MFDLPGPIGTLANFLVIVLGFGSIVFIHELGHFVAAKWAGIRVLAFSIGFGQIVGSYRKGVGFRRGSSEPEYLQLLKDAKSDNDSKRERAKSILDGQISPTEYRLSLLPLGGYVKMLGQEDLNPGAVSEEPDSYQNCSAPKRMVVISAGVIMNIIMAAMLFILVFMVGLRVIPPQVGYVSQNSPAQNATPMNMTDLSPGLVRGDQILSINGNKMFSYEAILPEIAMSSKSRATSVVVQRDGIDLPIEFEVYPEIANHTGLLDIGIYASVSTTLKDPKAQNEQDLMSRILRSSGLGDISQGDTVLSVDGEDIRSPFDLLDAAEGSNGNPIAVVYEHNGETQNTVFEPVPALQLDAVEMGDGLQQIQHLLGLHGVMMVDPFARQEDTKQGLQPGDIFAKVGSTDFPSIPQGIEIIRANKGRSLNLVVLRKTEDGLFSRVKLEVDVLKDGTVGFYPTTTTNEYNFVTNPVPLMIPNPDDSDKYDSIATPASSIVSYPGSQILRVGDQEIESLREVQFAIYTYTDEAFLEGQEEFVVPMHIQLPFPTQSDGTVPSTIKEWTLSRSDVETIRELGWTLTGSVDMVNLFEFAQVIDKAPSPVAAISRGISESRRVMLQTYITFLRLFEGSVQVKHLKGPVGIAHIGTQIASQGWVWVLFFMALISINLAVINFLPLPIVDGGQFLMLLYEWIRGKPVPIIVQNVATMAGLLMIGTIFLYVTFNDIKAIFGV